MTPPEHSDIEDLLDLGISRAFGGESGEDLGALLADLDAVPKDAPETPPERIGRFVVLGVLAQGGMGIVLRAHDPELEREVAIKLIRRRPADDAALCRLFAAEARVMGQLQHPGIVPVHEVGTTADGRLFYVMKVIAGESLAAIIARAAANPGDRHAALAVFARVCDTVAFAHARGVIHADLKPANVMVGAFGEVQVLDWGFARALAASTGPEDAGRPRIMGTPGYMAPEQARGQNEAIDARSDVFALGAVLCEILTGAPAYRGTTRSEVYLRARRAWLDDAEARLGAITADPHLTDLARRCLREDPAQRPADAGAVAAAIHAYLAAVEQRALDAGLAAARAETRAQEEQRRRRVTLVAALVVLVAFAAIGVLVWTLERREQNARAETAALLDAARLRVVELRDHARAGGADVEARWSAASASAAEARALAGGAAPATLLSARVAALCDEVQAEAQTATRDARAARLLATARPHLGEERPLRIVEGEYRALMAVFGVDADQDPAEKVGAAIRRSALAGQVAHALHRWAHARRARSGAQAKSWQHLLRLADAVDPDPWRTHLRECCSGLDVPGLEAIAAEPDLGAHHSNSLGLLAECLTSVGRRDAAIATYRIAHLHHPDDYAIAHDLAAILERLRHPPTAEVVRLFAAALAVRPGDPHAMVDLATALAQDGQLAPARELAERVQGIAPDYPRLWLSLASIRQVSGDTAGAFAAAKAAVAAEPNSALAHVLLAHHLRATGEVDQALDAAERAVELAPRFPPALRAAGVARLDAGLLGEAIEAFRTAVDVDPQDHELWYHLGLAFTQVGRFVDALDAYRRALELQPDYAEAQCNLSSALAQAGDFEAARTALVIGAELGRKRAGWSYPTADWLASLERSLALLPDLDGLIAGGELPADAERARALGALAVVRGEPALALRLFDLVQAQLGPAGTPYFEVVRACGAIARAAGVPDAVRLAANDRAMGLLKPVFAGLQAAKAQGKASRREVLALLARWRLDPDLEVFREAAASPWMTAEAATAWAELWRAIDQFEASVHGH